MRASPLTPTVALGARGRPLRLASACVLGRRDHRSAAAVHLDDEHLSVIVGHGGSVEKTASFSAHCIDHAQRRSRARRPLVEFCEEPPRRSEGHQRAQLDDRGDGAEAEARAHAELPVDREIHAAPSADRTPDRSPERHLAEACPDVVLALPVRVKRVTYALARVRRRPRARSARERVRSPRARARATTTKARPPSRRVSPSPSVPRTCGCARSRPGLPVRRARYSSPWGSFRLVFVSSNRISAANEPRLSTYAL